MADYNGVKIKPKTKIKVRRRSNKLYKFQYINTFLILCILAYLTKEHWLSLLLSLIK